MNKAQEIKDMSWEDFMMLDEVYSGGYESTGFYFQYLSSDEEVDVRVPKPEGATENDEWGAPVYEEAINALQTLVIKAYEELEQ